VLVDVLAGLMSRITWVDYGTAETASRNFLRRFFRAIQSGAAQRRILRLGGCSHAYTCCSQ